MEKLGQNNIYSQYLGNKAILRTYKGTDLINEYVPLYTPPVDWSDIRTDCPENSIALYAGHTTDYSQYDNLGFTANCVGGYNVFIDGTQYGSTYASGAQCSITWSTSGITTGDDITTPTALKAHKIWITPATEGNNITSLKSYRVAASGIEEQGILWAHFNLTNTINIRNSFSTYNGTYNVNLFAITAKNDLIKTTDILKGIINQGTDKGFRCSQYIEYLPAFYSQNDITPVDFQARNATAKLNTIRLYGNSTYRLDYHSFAFSANFKKIKTKKQMTTLSEIYYAFQGAISLEELPDIDYSNATAMQDFLTNAISLKDTVLDVSSATGLTRIGCYGTSTYFMSGFKGLRVSNEAPFNNATSPQINVSYTGMDRNALVQLFNDLPYNVGYEVVGSPTINNGIASGFSSSDYLESNYNFPSASALNGLISQVEFTTPNDTPFYGTHLLYTKFTTIRDCGIYLGSSGRIGCYVGRENQLSSAANTIQPNSTYVVRQVIDNSHLYLYLGPDENNLSIIANKEMESITLAPESKIIIGVNSAKVNPFPGSINLNNTYIKINDVYWFRGQPAMTKTLSCVGCTGNQNKLTIVGSPTIQDSVVSGFSNDDYLSINNTFNPTDTWEIISRVNTPEPKNSYYFIAGQGYTLCVGTEGSGRLKSFFSSNGSSWNIGNIVGTRVINSNDWYYVKIGFNGTQYYMESSTDGIIYDDRKVINSTEKINQGNLLIGKTGLFSALHWRGNIDLNNTYIKINDELWFNREQYLLPEDKAIATNKNWTLTLS